MKICEVTDEYRKIEVGFLYYYEKSDLYFFEIAPGLKRKDAPIFFDSFLREGRQTVGPEYSRRFVESRIVPRDRQNLRSILHNAGMTEYDPYRLLMFSGGKSSQDDCRIQEVRENPDWLSSRRGKWITAAAPLDHFRLFLCFRDGTCRIADMREVLKGSRTMEILLSREEDFKRVKTAGEGRALRWGEGQLCMYEDLYQSGKLLPLRENDVRQILLSQLRDISDLCQEAKASRQYVNRILKNQSVRELRRCGSSSLYLAQDVGNIFDS